MELRREAESALLLASTNRSPGVYFCDFMTSLCLALQNDALLQKILRGKYCALMFISSYFSKSSVISFRSPSLLAEMIMYSSMLHAGFSA